MSKAYCGIGTVPKGQKRGSMKDCATSGQVRYYGLKKIDSKLIEFAKQSKKGSAKRNTIIEAKATIKGKINAITKKFKAEKDLSKKKLLNEQYKKLVVELKKLNAQLDQLSASRMGRSKSRSHKSSKRSKSRSHKSSKRSKRSKSRKGKKY